MCQSTFENNYTIPSDNRELQLGKVLRVASNYYTIPSDNRELQHFKSFKRNSGDYTIPSDNRELQQAIVEPLTKFIIPYQVITGNYNEYYHDNIIDVIIPYQVITGNYNRRGKKED